MKLVRRICYHLFSFAWLVCSLSILGETARCADKPVKKVTDKTLDHPEPPRTEREEKNELTRDVSSQLQHSPRIEVVRKNYIDDFVFGRMERDKIPHAGLSSDLEFVRRIHLDLTGRIPESEVIRKFISNKDAQKRNKLIETLIRPERYQFQENDPFSVFQPDGQNPVPR